MIVKLLENEQVKFHIHRVPHESCGTILNLSGHLLELYSQCLLMNTKCSHLWQYFRRTGKKDSFNERHSDLVHMVGQVEHRRI